MFERPEHGNRALLVHVVMGGSDVLHGERDSDSHCEEFVELARSAGLEVVELVRGSRAKPDPKTFIGRGKVEEIGLLLGNLDVDVVLFGQQLSPSQERNLERVLKCRVLDRNTLILDIFAQRARTFEGKLQVELAQLQHLSTRLVRGWTHLERQKGGIGLRGPGETQLETDRRLLAARVKTLQKRLDKVRRQREQGRRKRTRSGTPTLALVGYTNAGKSTLFNRLTSASVLSADQLFATLDPTLRKLDLPHGTQVVLADTVGFISDLPHELVEAFRSTLVETREADLLLHVIDVSDDERQLRRDDVDAVLDSIGADDVPQLLVFNKIDRLGGRGESTGPQTAHIESDESGDAVAVWLSARTGEGCELLLEAIRQRLSGQRVQGWIRLAPRQGQARARFYAASAVLEERVDVDGALLLHIDMDAGEFDRLSGEQRISQAVYPDSQHAASAG